MASAAKCPRTACQRTVLVQKGNKYILRQEGQKTDWKLGNFVKYFISTTHHIFNKYLDCQCLRANPFVFILGENRFVFCDELLQNDRFVLNFTALCTDVTIIPKMKIIMLINCKAVSLFSKQSCFHQQEISVVFLSWSLYVICKPFGKELPEALCTNAVHVEYVFGNVVGCQQMN